VSEGRGTHAATSNVCDLLDALLRLGAANTADLAAATDTHRDTARRVLAELSARNWVYLDERELWRLGPALPQIGLSWLQQQEHQARVLRQRIEDACEPHAWKIVDGRLQWLPTGAR
jgi:DNA-binding IclR family transcriptional regulator